MVTVMVPLIVPTGTVVVMLVEVLAVTTATVPLNLTVLLEIVVGSKSAPVIVTVVPITPLRGLKLVIEGIVVKLDELVAV